MALLARLCSKALGVVYHVQASPNVTRALLVSMAPGQAQAAPTSPLAQPMCGWQGPEAGPFRAVGQALEVIPRTLAQNCGANVIRVLTKLRSQHGSSEKCTMGLNGHTGTVPHALMWGDACSPRDIPQLQRQALCMAYGHKTVPVIYKPLLASCTTCLPGLCGVKLLQVANSHCAAGTR